MLPTRCKSLALRLPQWCQSRSKLVLMSQVGLLCLSVVGILGLPGRSQTDPLPPASTVAPTPTEPAAPAPLEPLPAESVSPSPEPALPYPQINSPEPTAWPSAPAPAEGADLSPAPGIAAPSSTPNIAPPSPSPSVTPSSPASGVTTPSSSCAGNGLPHNSSLDGVFKQLTQTISWLGDPVVSMNNLIANLAPPLSAYLNPTVWPALNERAKQARVPVMMYHDILPEKKVFFDVTPQEFEAHLKLIQEKGLTPISLDQLTVHLRTGLPLPEKPILLTFDDGYEGHFTHVFPLLKKYNYPAVFSIYTSKVGKQLGRSSLSWEQIKEMAADPLVTIASHSVSHPPNLTLLTDAQLTQEIQQSKQILESQLGIPIRYFTYPEGHYDARVADLVGKSGYLAALTMNDADERLAGQSESLLAIGRIGQSRFAEMVDVAWGGADIPRWNLGFDFSAPVTQLQTTIDNVPFTLIAGGKPITIHAKTRGQVQDFIQGTGAIAAVDGGFFSLESLDSNIMIGPVFSQTTGKFVPGNASENPRLNGRPLVLISASEVRYIPFDATKHNTLDGIKAEMPDATDAFVAAGFLVRNSEPQPAASFNNLQDFDADRHRAFWGINQNGQPVIGVSTEPIDAVSLGIALLKAGYREAVMLDSGASTSLAYKGESLVPYVPRPVPHAVGLVPTETATSTAITCIVAQQ
jgi:poly-beta-1,6-N-acetyl-D-glucosamine N-deacetylase